VVPAEHATLVVIGSHYVITLAALNAQTGDALACEQSEAESKEQVLKALDRAASSLRRKLGESLLSVQKFATPLEEATTSSLEALKAFSLGQAEFHRGADGRAIPHLKHAIESGPISPWRMPLWARSSDTSGNQSKLRIV
jgi:hypothetical protein